MSTPAMIFYKDENGFFNGSVCFSDGYLSGLGKMLQNYFNSPELAKALVEHGEIRTIGKSLETVEFYSRDLGDPLVIARGLTKQGMIDEGSYYHLAYFFENGAWYVSEHETDAGELLATAIYQDAR